MFARKQKIESSLGAAKPQNRLFGLLRSNVGFQTPLVSLEKKAPDFYDKSQKEIENAMLDAEYNKAKVIMTTQQARSYC